MGGGAWEKIAEYKGTTSLSDNAQRLPTQTLSSITLSSLKNTYKEICLIYLSNSPAQIPNNGYYPVTSLMIPTNEISVSSTGYNNYIALHGMDIIVNAGFSLQISDSGDSCVVDIAIKSSTSTTYKRGWSLYGKK